MKKVVISLLSILVIFIVITLGFKYYVKSNLESHPFAQKGSEVSIEVKNGDTFNQLIERYSSKFNSTSMLKLYVKSKNIDTKNIKPGEHQMSTDITLAQFVSILKTDTKDKNVVKVTFPEGFGIADIAKRLEENGLISKDDFIAACKAYDLPDYIKADSKRKYNLEGFLFPDTYELKKGMSGEDIITQMLLRFEYVINDIGIKQNDVVKKDDIDKIITMASIVEKEAQAKNERSIVASVFYNRLKKNMSLESCATVLYALDKIKVVLSNKDIQVKSPYNTYVVKGLPIGPICCPGRAAIEAALSPEKTDYYYFVANMVKNDGTMIFSKTLTEHNANVKKYEK